MSDLLRNLVETSNIQKEEDLLVLAVHCYLCNNSFTCTGLEGQAEAISNQDASDQNLPTGWNEQSGFYSICYKFQSEEYLLKSLQIENKLAFYLLRVSTGDVQEETIAVNQFVTHADSTVSLDRYRDLKLLWRLLDKSLLKKSETSSKANRGSTEDRRTDDYPSAIPVDPLRIGQPSRYPGNPTQFPPVDPFAYGDPDRLPGHAGAGGMRLDPFRSGGTGFRAPFNPYTGETPGARFDPFGPTPEINAQFQPRNPRDPFDPDPDHMRRPNFDDDMFM